MKEETLGYDITVLFHHSGINGISMDAYDITGKYNWKTGDQEMALNFMVLFLT